MYKGVLKEVGSLAKPKAIKLTDNSFWMITKLSTIILVVFATLVSLKQFFGDPIQCIYGGSKERLKVAETFCWMTGTYINPIFMNGTIGKSIITYGIGAYSQREERKYQRYYQWLVPILILQAFIFFIPYKLWKCWESGRVAFLCKPIESPIMDEDWTTKHSKRILNYFSAMSTKIHRTYALKYIFCEFLAYCSVAVNATMLHFFLGNFFMDFRHALISMLEMDWTVWNKEVSLIFPKLAKCDFYQFGHSGTIERHDVLCLLPQNIINEKIFTFIYFWYIILMLLCVYKMVILMLLIVSKDRRLSSVRQMTHSMTSNFTAEVVTKKGTIGLWFILRQISLNLNTVLLNDLIAEMNEQLRGVSYKSNRESQEL